MPMLLSLGGDDHVATAQQRGIAGKTAPGHHADHRHLAVEPREAGEGRHVQAGHDRHVHITRRPPPPSANSTTGSRFCSATPSSRSVFWWLRMPCVPASTVAS
jgi:hypothetical protein